MRLKKIENSRFMKIDDNNFVMIYKGKMKIIKLEQLLKMTYKSYKHYQKTIDK